jgi:hypothetical protein
MCKDSDPVAKSFHRENADRMFWSVLWRACQGKSENR